MELTIQLRPEIADILHHEVAARTQEEELEKITKQLGANLERLHPQPNYSKVKGYKELEQTTRDLGITLEPLHPGIKDPTLATYFTVQVPSREAAQHIIDRLSQSTGVEAAYVKPPDEAP